MPTILVLLAAYIYLNGLSNWDRPSHPVNNWQKASFFFGLFLVFFALQSPLDPISDHLLSFHQVQHFLLRMVAPMFILLGAPLTPMLRGLPPWARQGIIRPLARNHYVRQLYSLLTNPIFTIFFFMGSLYLWQFPGAFNLALRSDEVHALMHLTMSASGFLFWWVVIDPPPHRSRLHYGLRVLYLGLIVLPNTLLGAAITFSSQPGEHIYEAYMEVFSALRPGVAYRPATGGPDALGSGRHDEHRCRRHCHDHVVPAGRGSQPGAIASELTGA